MQSQFFHPTYVVNLGSLVCWIYAVEGSDMGVQRELQHFINSQRTQIFQSNSVERVIVHFSLPTLIVEKRVFKMLRIGLTYFKHWIKQIFVQQLQKLVLHFCFPYVFPHARRFYKWHDAIICSQYCLSSQQQTSHDAIDFFDLSIIITSDIPKPGLTREPPICTGDPENGA